MKRVVLKISSKRIGCLLVVFTLLLSRSIAQSSEDWWQHFAKSGNNATSAIRCQTGPAAAQIWGQGVRRISTQESAVTANIFGERQDRSLLFHGGANGLLGTKDLELNYEVTDHTDKIWKVGNSKDITALADGNSVDFHIEIAADALPKEQYLVFRVRITDKQGGCLGSTDIPFGVSRQDGDDGDFPLPFAVSRSTTESPFGFISRTLGKDRTTPGFGSKDLYATRLAGANWIRGGYAWIQDTPKSPIRDGADWFRVFVGRYGFRMLPMLGQGYPAWATRDHATGLATGTNVADLGAFGSFVSEACRQLGHQITHLQIFNEPEFVDEQRVRTFVNAMESAYKAVKGCDAQVKVVAGGFNSGIRPLTTYLKVGVGRFSDAIDIHNYAVSLGQMEQWMKEQAELIHEYAPGKEIWTTEIAPRPTQRRAPLEVADWIIKAHVLGFRYGFAKLFWFGWRPSGVPDWDAAIVDEDQNATPRPAFFAYRVLTRKLAAKRFVEDLSKKGGCRTFLFAETAGKKQIWVLWTENGSGCEVPVGSGADGSAYTVTDFLGNVSVTRIRNGKLGVFANHPVFVEADTGSGNADAPRSVNGTGGS